MSTAEELLAPRKFLITIPAETVARAAADEEDLQVLVWDWPDAPVEADVRLSQDHAEPWVPLNLVAGGRVGRVL